MITVIVGEEKKIFTVHKHILCSKSEYFKTAVKPIWTSHGARCLELPEDIPEAFNPYLTWLYFSKLYLSLEEDDTVGDVAHIFHSVIDAYVLGDKLLDADYKGQPFVGLHIVHILTSLDAATEALVMTSRKMVGGKTYAMSIDQRRRVYSETSEGSSLRRLVAHQFSRLHNLDRHLDQGEEPPTFLYDLAIAMTKKDELSTIVAARICSFHEHEKGDEKCYRRKIELAI